jgi:hypothetical protein
VSKGVLSEYDAETVFTSLDAIIMLAQEMEDCIDGVRENWHPRNSILSSPLDSIEKYFKIYKEYCNNFMKGKNIMDSVSENEEFQQIMRSHPLDIHSYLIKPVQRPPKYKLLLRDYIKCLPADHLDKQALEKTYIIYEQLVDDINESMENQSKMQKMMTLEKMFGDDIYESSRTYKTEFSANNF